MTPMPTAVRFNPPGDVPGPPVQFESEEMGDPGAGYGFESDHTYEGDWFFFHTDHLGSTSYLTDTLGNVSQFVWYAPYGESLVDEHTTTYENPFKFSGKELDDITGLYDHGARSRNPISTLWYGVDPRYEEFPEMSPFAYCHGNPVRLVDPDGRGDEETSDIKETRIQNIQQQLSDLKQSISNTATELGNTLCETAQSVGQSVVDWYDKADIKGAAWSSVGVVGGVIEVVGGAASSETGVGCLMLGDGIVRIGTNSAKVYYCLFGDSKTSDAIPSNIGAAIGKGIDVVCMDTPTDQCGGFQAADGVINDVSMFFLTGGNGASYTKMADGIGMGKTSEAVGGIGEVVVNSTSYVQSSVSNLSTYKKAK